MVDVAAAAGVSPMTVSRALRADASVSKEKREHVLRVIEEMGYVPDSLAGALSSKRSGFVALMLRTISNSNLSETVTALDQALQQSGLELLIGNVGHTLEKEEALIEAMLRRRPEAFVLSGGNHTERSRKLLLGAGIPVVEAFELPEKPIDQVVGFSNAAATKAMVMRLHQRGYRHIAYMGSGSDQTTRGADRRRGYLEAIAELKAERAIVVSVGEPPTTMRQGSEAVLRLVEQYPQVDAAVCVSDMVAFGAIMECHRRGWDVPGRIAIAGFGNSEIAAVSHPGITTVGIDARQIGRDIGAILLESLGAARKGEKRISTTHMIDYEIIERGSTSGS
jgi:LacI family transcriptional regulator, gluconate utilization system Gnt-I transcriptional repressor